MSVYLCRMMNDVSTLTPIQIRFSDIDVMGHVNNAVYLSYFELARMHFFKELIGEKWDWNKLGILLARNEVNYRLPILLNDDDVHIKTWCTSIGNSSMTVEYEVFKSVKGEQVVVTTGASVLVCFDYISQSKIPVPEIWKAKLIG